MTNIYRLIAYLLYTILLMYIMFKVTVLEHSFKTNGFLLDKTYLRLSFLSVFPVAAGILFSLPAFLSNFKKPGIWSIDWVKLFSLGIPTFYVAMSPLLYFSPIGKYLPAVGSAMMYFSGTPVIICGTVFGYLILTVFEKQDMDDFIRF